MAIDRPEATDAAPIRAEASAEDGAETTFLPREEWAIRGPRALGQRGVVSQGKKAVTRHCGIGGRGEAGLGPDRATEEAARERSTDRKDGRGRRPLGDSKGTRAITIRGSTHFLLRLTAVQPRSFAIT
jgi:hypothetical protein